MINCHQWVEKSLKSIECHLFYCGIDTNKKGFLNFSTLQYHLADWKTNRACEALSNVCSMRPNFLFCCVPKKDVSSWLNYSTESYFLFDYMTSKDIANLLEFLFPTNCLLRFCTNIFSTAFSAFLTDPNRLLDFCPSKQLPTLLDRLTVSNLLFDCFEHLWCSSFFRKLKGAKSSIWLSDRSASIRLASFPSL